MCFATSQREAALRGNVAIQNNLFQPGTVLHEVIVGAFRSAGSSVEFWCETNQVHTGTARTATYGQSGARAMIREALAEREERVQIDMRRHIHDF